MDNCNKIKRRNEYNLSKCSASISEEYTWDELTGYVTQWNIEKCVREKYQKLKNKWIGHIHRLEDF